MTSPDELPHGLRRPLYAGKALAGVLPSAAATLGADGGLWRSELLELRREEARSVLVVLADGLGALALRERRGHAPFLNKGYDTTLTCGFPSTTATSLATLGTGLGPGLTGMLGYSLRDPDTRRPARMIQWDLRTEPAVWQNKPTVFERLRDMGHSSTSIGPSRFESSGLTQASLRGARWVGVDSTDSYVRAARRAQTEGGLAYLYWKNVDATGHSHGPNSWEWTQALEELDGLIQRIVRHSPPDCEIWLTADHGMVDVSGARQWDVAHNEALGRDVELVAGEPRALHLYTRPNRSGEVAERWRDELGGAAAVWTRTEAIAAGLFGPTEERRHQTIGDVVVAMTGTDTVVDSRVQTPQAMALPGVHGSLTDEEMLIPLLRWRS